MPPDELESWLRQLCAPSALAAAVHSLPEMSAPAVRWWLAALHSQRVAHLLVVSNASALDAETAELQAAEAPAPFNARSTAHLRTRHDR